MYKPYTVCTNRPTNLYKNIYKPYKPYSKDQQKITHNCRVWFVWFVYVVRDVCRTVCTRFLYGLYGVSDACDWHPCSITLALAVWSATRTSASISICRIATGCIQQYRDERMSHKSHQSIACTSHHHIHRRDHHTSPESRTVLCFMHYTCI